MHEHLPYFGSQGHHYTQQLRVIRHYAVIWDSTGGCTVMMNDFMQSSFFLGLTPGNSVSQTRS